MPPITNATPTPTDLPTDASAAPADRGADGRSARSQRTRDAVVDALLALLRSGNLRPTAREIADEAGTSLRSVYVHFDDLEDLFCAASNRQGELIEPLLYAIDEGAPFEERLRQFVELRTTVWETIGPVRNAASLQEPFSPSLASILAETRRVSLLDVQRVFAREFAAMDPEAAAKVLAAVDALTSGAAWDHWRRYQQCSIDDAAEILRDTLRRLLLAKGDC